MQSWFEVLPDEEELRPFVTKRYIRLRQNYWKIMLFYGGNYPGVKCVFSALQSALTKCSYGGEKKKKLKGISAEYPVAGIAKR